jgi:hypothetical protein
VFEQLANHFQAEEEKLCFAIKPGTECMISFTFCGNHFKIDQETYRLFKK